MTESELSEIEAAVGFTLPPEYRRVALEFPFRPIGRDWVYWFYDDPSRVIDGTLFPLSNGEYDRAGWQTGYLTIGESAAGDPFVMDTAAPGLPVLCLSHESQQIEPEHSTFAAFVAEWSNAGDQVAAHLAAEKAAERAEWRSRIRRTLFFVLVAIPGCIVFAGLVSWCVLWWNR